MNNQLPPPGHSMLIFGREQLFQFLKRFEWLGMRKVSRVSDYRAGVGAQLEWER
jgi:hypothetical protein